MRICYIAAADSIHSLKWITYFRDRGHEVSWLSFTMPAEGAVEGIDFHRLPRGLFPGAKIPAGIAAIRSFVGKTRPDILHAHYLGVYGLLGACSGFHPYIGTAWGSDIIFAGKSPVKGPLVRHVLRTCDILTCDAEHMKKRMMEMGTPGGKITVVNFGTDVKKFDPSRKSACLRELAGAHEGDPVIISLRNFEPVYDIATLIRAVPAVLGEFPRAKFLLVGRGSEETALRTLASELGVNGSVVFPGFIPNARLPELLASADIYVSTSLSDAGLSASTSEAMASGVPVVVSDSGENRLWIKEGEQGCLFPVRDHETLAAKLVYLLRDPEARRQVSGRGRGKIVECNNFYNEMEKMERLYLTAAGKGCV